MFKLLLYLPLLLSFGVFPLNVSAQIFFSNSANVYVASNATLYCNGGIQLIGNSTLTNQGEITTTLLSSNSSAGNFEIQLQANVDGNGVYRVEQDWINDGLFNAQTSEVVLFGNKEQFISSTNGVETQFNNLTLRGGGSNQDARKTLVNVNAATGIDGILDLANRELNTDTQLFTVQNKSQHAILFATPFKAEGFVSSIGNGALVRFTNQKETYVFPVGSSVGVRRFRPVTIEPNSLDENIFAVRFNNYSGNIDQYNVTDFQEPISEVNDGFYHSVEQIQGTISPDLSLFYLPADDREWEGVGIWNPWDRKWNAVASAKEVIGDFSAYKLINWNLSNTMNHFALINTSTPLSIPNVFTPNNDGINDHFVISGTGFTEYQLVIVNRWGEIVFETDNPKNGWDGKSNGKLCSDGVYFYSFSAVQNKESLKKHGHITLIGNK